MEQNPLPENASDWLDRLSQLHGVPFEYLVPDERLLPVESIRFFYLDPNWLAALRDGALSIGRVTTREQAHDQALAEDPRAEAAAPASGFLLRSAVVSGWPGLEITAYSDVAGQDSLGVLRLERLSRSVLLALFDGVLQRVDLGEPPEGVHFGADFVDLSYEKSSLRGLGDGPAAGTKIPLSPPLKVPMRSRPSRVIDVEKLAGALKSKLQAKGAWGSESFTSAQFAVEMVESPARQIFNNRASRVAGDGNPEDSEHER